MTTLFGWDSGLKSFVHSFYTAIKYTNKLIQSSMPLANKVDLTDRKKYDIKNILLFDIKLGGKFDRTGIIIQLAFTN